MTRLLDLTLDTAEENLALDEALLLEAEAAAAADVPHAEVLRIWEPVRPLVVVGRGSRISREVNVAACHRDGVPILRRTSGGAAIVAAPGCLMYALVLAYAGRPHLRAISETHAYVLGHLADALAGHVPGVARAGTSDLAVGGRKFSGNSLRCRRTHLLYHGTLLYAMDLDLAERYLRIPPREPDYRAGRGHAEFLVNLPLSCEVLRNVLAAAWSASPCDATDAGINEPPVEGPLSDRWPRRLTAELVAEKYGRREWNERQG